MSNPAKPDVRATASDAFSLPVGLHARATPAAPDGFAAAVALEAIGQTLAHDMKQPLSAIGAEAAACGNWLTDSSANLSQVLASLRAIGEDARRASELVDRVQQLLSRADSSGEYAFDPWVQELVQTLRPQLRERGLTLASALCADGARVRLDAEPLRQALAQLLRVAADACQAAPAARRSITLRTRLQDQAQPRFIELTLECEGVPVAEPPRDLLELLASTQAQAAALALCRSIVERHGGRLQLLHQAPRGVTFRIVLPVCGVRPVTSG